jgi:hypothetical protein
MYLLFSINKRIIIIHILNPKYIWTMEVKCGHFHLINLQRLKIDLKSHMFRFSSSLLEITFFYTRFFLHTKNKNYIIYFCGSFLYSQSSERERERDEIRFVCRFISTNWNKEKIILDAFLNILYEKAAGC